MSPNWHFGREKNVSYFLSWPTSCCSTPTHIGRWFWLAIARLRIVFSCACVGACGVGDGGGLWWGEFAGVIKTSELEWVGISIFSFDCSIVVGALIFSLSDLFCETVRCVGSEDVGLCCLCRGRCSRASSSLVLLLLTREDSPTIIIGKEIVFIKCWGRVAVEHL